MTKTSLKVKFNVKFNSNHHFLCKWYLSDILFWYLNLSFPTENQVENHIEVWQLLRDKKYGENFKNFMEHALCYFRLVFQLTTIRHRITEFQTGSIKTNHQWFATMNFRFSVIFAQTGNEILLKDPAWNFGGSTFMKRDC